MSTMNNNTIDIVLQDSKQEDIVLTDTIENVGANELAEACTIADSARKKDGSTFQWSMVKLYKGLSSSNNSQTMMDKLQSLIV